jgi:hypothetical protein
MEYKKTPSSLLPNRVEFLEADILSIIESADFSDFSNFKAYWKSNGLSMIHHSIRPKENKDEFYLVAYQILTDLVKTSQELAIKSLFVLFTLFCTQHRSPVLIPISPEVAEILLKLSETHETCRNLLGKLAGLQAFDFCLSEGVKSFIRPKKTHSEGSTQAETEGKVSETVFTPVVIDHDSLVSQSIHYACSKEKLKQKLEANLHFFSNQGVPSSDFAKNFKAENVKLLNLSNPLFPDLLRSRFHLVKQYIEKLKSEDVFITDS